MNVELGSRKNVTVKVVLLVLGNVPRVPVRSGPALGPACWSKSPRHQLRAVKKQLVHLLTKYTAILANKSLVADLSSPVVRELRGVVFAAVL